jgi:glycosyltransferase involved in cell wall biosynthesis
MVRDGETGMVIPGGDAPAMAKAVIHLLENPELALALARGAHGEIERFTWPQVREAWVQIYADTSPVPGSVARPWPGRPGGERGAR